MNDDWTTLNEILSGLPGATPDAARAQHVRDTCHRKLARPQFQRLLESAVVGGFCAVYLCLLALLALHSPRLL